MVYSNSPETCLCPNKLCLLLNQYKDRQKGGIASNENKIFHEENFFSTKAFFKLILEGIDSADLPTNLTLLLSNDTF